MLEYYLEIQTTITAGSVLPGKLREQQLFLWYSAQRDGRLKRHVFELYLVLTIEENNPCSWWDSAGEWLNHSMANPISRFPSLLYPFVQIPVPVTQIPFLQ